MLSQLNNLLAQNVMLVVLNQSFTATEYRRAMQQFGEVMKEQYRIYLTEGEPLVSVPSNPLTASNDQAAKFDTNATWHTEHTNLERPQEFTYFYAVKLPDSGGGISVCNMSVAYEVLPSHKQRQLKELKQQKNAVSFHKIKTKTVTEMDAKKNQDILEDLLAEVMKPEFTHSYEWKPDDLLMIDNRTGMHKAVEDYDHNQQRHLCRILIRGERPYQ